MIYCKENTMTKFTDPPSVTLRMDPPSPISELDRRNVTLFCDLESGYPGTLSKVNWYMDGNLLKELPDCHSENADLCDIDPSKLLLEHVSKLFHGNYSCQAANEAGWSPMSEPRQLEIYCEYMRELLLLESQVYETGKYASGPPINSHNPPRKTRNTSKNR